MIRKESVAIPSYTSPELSVLNFETALSYLQSASINYVEIIPQVDENILEESTEIEF